MSNKHKNSEELGHNKTAIHSLEIIFLTFVGIVIVAAFLEALTYQFVSSRTPIVIMVPLLLLIGVQALRLKKGGALREVQYHLAEAVRGRVPTFSKLTALTGAFVAIVGVIWVFGHYIGVFGFVLLLMRWLAREKWVLTLITAGVTTAVIYLVFEHGFNVELYRGLFFRYLAGYRDF